MAILGPFDFKGGYSPGYDFTTLPQGKGYATTMENCRIKAGYVAPRWGQTVMSSAALVGGNQVLGLISWNDTVNSKTAVVATCGSKLWIADGTGWIPASTTPTIAFTDRTGALAASSLSGLTTFDSLNNILVGSANSASSGAPFKVTAYNANGAALGGSPPNADIAKQVNNFMFLSRNLSSTTTQSTVYWSNVNDPETWTGTNVLNFNKNDGEPIMALGSIGTDLYIFKKTSIGRLGTTTITTSGAVTLGPLTTVIRGIGCCGPRALDNLPNGNIIFVGFDGRFYEFDGSSLLDRSREVYPGHDAYDDGQYNSGGHGNFGISGGIANVNTFVKTVRGYDEVWISYTTSIRGLSNIVFMYDYGKQLWNGNADFSTANTAIAPYSMSTMTLSGSINSEIESTDFIIYGDNNGTIIGCGDPVHPYPTNSAGTAKSFSIGTTIDLMTENGPFIPRSIFFETSNTNTSGARLSSLTLNASYDAYAGSTQIYSGSGQIPARVIVPISFLSDSIGTNIFPSFISLLWTGTGTGSSTNSEILRLGKFWLSDEIIR